MHGSKKRVGREVATKDSKGYSCRTESIVYVFVNFAFLQVVNFFFSSFILSLKPFW